MSAPHPTVEGFDAPATPADRRRGNARFAYAQEASSQGGSSPFENLLFVDSGVPHAG
jgi:hypothetical protein